VGLGASRKLAAVPDGGAEPPSNRRPPHRTRGRGRIASMAPILQLEGEGGRCGREVGGRCGKASGWWESFFRLGVPGKPGYYTSSLVGHGGTDCLRGTTPARPACGGAGDGGAKQGSSVLLLLERKSCRGVYAYMQIPNYTKAYVATPVYYKTTSRRDLPRTPSNVRIIRLDRSPDCAGKWRGRGPWRWRPPAGGETFGAPLFLSSKSRSGSELTVLNGFFLKNSNGFVTKSFFCTHTLNF
jgi:hypothetical protein